MRECKRNAPAKARIIRKARAKWTEEKLATSAWRSDPPPAKLLEATALINIPIRATPIVEASMRKVATIPIATPNFV